MIVSLSWLKTASSSWVTFLVIKRTGYLYSIFVAQSGRITRCPNRCDSPNCSPASPHFKTDGVHTCHGPTTPPRVLDWRSTSSPSTLDDHPPGLSHAYCVDITFLCEIARPDDESIESAGTLLYSSLMGVGTSSKRPFACCKRYLLITISLLL